jgi:hypothetical protein
MNMQFVKTGEKVKETEIFDVVIDPINWRLPYDFPLHMMDLCQTVTDLHLRWVPPGVHFSQY